MKNKKNVSFRVLARNLISRRAVWCDNKATLFTPRSHCAARDYHVAGAPHNDDSGSDAQNKTRHYSIHVIPSVNEESH